MLARQEQLYKRLTEEGAKMLAMFEALPPAERAHTIYTDGAAWTVKDILAHQANTERSIRTLVDDILAGGAGASEDFSIDRFNTSQVEKMSTMSWGELIAAFRAARADMGALAQSLTDGQLDRRGRHPFLGVASIEDILRMLYRHNMLHMRDIRRALGG